MNKISQLRKQLKKKNELDIKKLRYKKYIILHIYEDQNNFVKLSENTILLSDKTTKNDTWEETKENNTWYDTYSQIMEQIWNEFIINRLEFSKKCNIITHDYTKTMLINFFLTTVPLFFNIEIFGSAVMSIFSNIEPNDIDMIADSNHEKNKFIKTMYIIFGNKFTHKKHKTEQDDKKHKTEQDDKKQVYTSYLKIHQIELKIDIIIKSGLCHLSNDFIESNIIWNKTGFGLKSSTSNDDKVEGEVKVEVEKIKQNLNHKILTFYPQETYDTCQKKLKLIQRYYKKIKSGYKFMNPCPGFEGIQFIYSFDDLNSILNNGLMCSDVINCVFEYLNLVDLSCRYCNKKFDRESMVITPQCKCGIINHSNPKPFYYGKKKKYISKNEWYYSYNKNIKNIDDIDEVEDVHDGYKSDCSCNSNTTMYFDQFNDFNNQRIKGFNIFCDLTNNNCSFHIDCMYQISKYMLRTNHDDDTICYECGYRFI